jgi:hypothetical protein
MKKLLLLLICCFALFALVGCDSAEGTWKFEQKVTVLGGASITKKAGENGVTEDYVVLTINKDGTAKLTGEDFDGGINFTWTETEDKVIKFVDGSGLIKVDAKIEKGRLIFDFGVSTYTLKK